MSSFGISPVCASLRAMRPPDGWPGDRTGGVSVSCRAAVPRRHAAPGRSGDTGCPGNHEGDRTGPVGRRPCGGDCRTGGHAGAGNHEHAAGQGSSGRGSQLDPRMFIDTDRLCSGTGGHDGTGSQQRGAGAGVRTGEALAAGAAGEGVVPVWRPDRGREPEPVLGVSGALPTEPSRPAGEAGAGAAAARAADAGESECAAAGV